MAAELPVNVMYNSARAERVSATLTLSTSGLFQSGVFGGVTGNSPIEG